MTEHKTPVTVIGLGAMGSALARTLIAAGHPTTVWNRTPRALDGATATTRAIGAQVGGTYVDGAILAVQAAGVRLTDVSREYGVRPDLMEAIDALIQEGVDAGHGDEDLSALADLLVPA